jgi:triosephosphate isomerase
MAKKRQSSRPCVIIGNWKMYKTIADAIQFIESLIKELQPPQPSLRVCLAVPFTAIKECAEKAASTPLVIGAQNMNDASEGAFTGEVAAPMLKEAGAQFVLLGHSERRKFFSESNSFINRKVIKALEASLQPVLCIGETFDERESGVTENVLREQLTSCLEGVSPEAADHIVVAYEPVWAIGTGKPATPEIVAETHAFIRKLLSEKYGPSGDVISLLYGGSVTPANAQSYLIEKDIDGLLVGSASLHPDSFSKICNVAQSAQLIQERI